MKAYRALLVCGAIFSFSAAKITASTVIDNTVSWPGWDVGTWGEPLQTATVGQTFTVGADTRLDSFTFFLAHDSSYDPLTFAAYLMLWNPTGNGGKVESSISGSMRRQRIRQERNAAFKNDRKRMMPGMSP